MMIKCMAVCYVVSLLVNFMKLADDDNNTWSTTYVL